LPGFLRRAVARLLVFRKTARDSARRSGRLARRFSDLVFYRVPGECRRCPACESPQLRLLEPLPLREAIAGRTVGFMTGCRACGILFANPLPTDARVRRFYSPEGEWGAPRQDRDLKGDRRPSDRYLDRVFDAAAIGWGIRTPAPGMRVLDFGCGAGGFLDALQSFGWETWGLDPAVKTAFARHAELKDLTQRTTFDLILLNHVLEHVTRPVDVLKGLAACLREGAVMYISVPDLDRLPMHGDLKYCINSRAHVCAFTRDCLVGLLARANLEILALVDEQSELTSGSPIRIRLLARVGQPATVPNNPLGAAQEALRQYHAGHDLSERRYRRRLPVRLQAGLEDAARKTDRRRRKMMKREPLT
jgi:SAM-dependent methyltransferase